MGIKFDSLPTDIQDNNVILEPGAYKAKIAKAEMKLTKTGNNCIDVMLDVQDESGKHLANVFDKILDPEQYTKEAIQYKVMCFMSSIGITEGEWQLKDIAKIAVGKTVFVKLSIQKDEQYGDKNTVNPFDKPCYSPATTKINEGFVTVPEGASDEEGVPFEDNETTADADY